MRFIHKESNEITSYVHSIDMHVMQCNSDGSSMSAEVPASSIEEMLRKADTLWGLALPYYLRISEAPETEAISLEKAVIEVEAPSIENRFLIVGYQDGGIISISGRTLPFQEHAERADWWQQKSRSS
jgi:hypothetical protein